MKTVTLRTLVREPRKVKRMTRLGQTVRVTDGGEPLWVLQPAGGTPIAKTERRRAIEEILDEVLTSKPSKISAVRLLEESRR